jgi:hypothetical protein
MQLIKPILEGRVRSLGVREEASTKYNAWLQGRLARSVWNSCNSYYRREGANGKITVTFPGPVSEFWWLARHPRYSDYEIVGGEEWERRRKLKGLVRVACKMLVLVVVVCAMRVPRWTLACK